MSGVISLVLERDGHDQPWGFRLQGGADVAMPLSVQRVLVGSPADGTLLKGDIITRISCTDTKGINHQQAADLFNNAGNQIAIHIKRPGAITLPAVGQPATAAPLVNGSPGQVAAPAPAPPTPENPAVRSLPKTTFVNKTSFLPPQKMPLANTEIFSIQSQPYRTLPLVQPTAKAFTGDLGPGSIVHLKMQDEHITGVREPKAAPESQAVAAKLKHDEIVMRQKVRMHYMGDEGSVLMLGADDMVGEEEVDATSKREWGEGSHHNSLINTQISGKKERSRSLYELTLSRFDKEEIESKEPKKEKVNAEYAKINKSTFRVGGEIVQLKKTPEDLAEVAKAKPEQHDLKKFSPYLNVPCNNIQDNLGITGRASGKRSLSISYTVETDRVEELTDDISLSREPSQDKYPNRDQLEVQYTIKLDEPPEDRPLSCSTDVEETIKLVLPKKVEKTFDSIDVAETVQIQREDLDEPEYSRYSKYSGSGSGYSGYSRYSGYTRPSGYTGSSGYARSSGYAGSSAYSEPSSYSKYNRYNRYSRY